MVGAAMRASRGVAIACLIGACWLAGPPARGQAELRANARAAAGRAQVRVVVATPQQLESVLALSSQVLSCRGAGAGRFEVAIAPDRLDALRAAGVAYD